MAYAKEQNNTIHIYIYGNGNGNDNINIFNLKQTIICLNSYTLSVIRTWHLGLV